MQASILILCWNYERYIQQCLDSIFVQTSQDLEVLFLDNASTDNSYEVAKRILYGSGFSYQIYRNDAPLSVSKNFNFLLDRSSGDYIFPFSADDWMTPENIAEKVALLKAKPEVAFVFGGGWWYYEDTNRYVEANVSKFKKGDMLKNLLLDRSSYFHPGPAYKRSVLYEVGKWDENLLIEDLDLNVRVAMRYQADFVPKPLIYYRRHSASFLSNFELMHTGFLQYCEKYKNNKKLPMSRWMASNYKFFSLEALDHKRYLLSLSYLFKSLNASPGIRSVATVFAYLRRLFASFKVLRNIWLPAKSFLQRGNTNITVHR